MNWIKRKYYDLLVYLFWPRDLPRVRFVYAEGRVRFVYAEGRGRWIEASDKNVSNLKFLVSAWNELYGENTHWLEYKP